MTSPDPVPRSAPDPAISVAHAAAPAPPPGRGAEPAPRSPAMTHLAWTSTGCLIACLVWCVIGFVVEQWCSISGDGDDDSSSGTSGRAPEGPGAPA